MSLNNYIIVQYQYNNMDSIDITDAAFALNVPDVNEVITAGSSSTDYTMFIYIGIAIIVSFIAIFIYNFYLNRQKNLPQEASEMDCPDGFCTMESHSSHI